MSQSFAAVCLLLAILRPCITLRYGAGFANINVHNLEHGDESNPIQNGTCREFLRLNKLNSCCADRKDECYMYHFDTRCYCDNFCDRPHADCCHDAMSTCLGIEELVQIPHVQGFCEKDGFYYKDLDRIKDNCNECTCHGDRWICTDVKCLIDERLISEINRGGSWTAGNYSQFWGKPLSYGFNFKLGTKLPEQKQRALDPTTSLAADLFDREIPSSYDFREDPDVQQFLRRRPIRDQGECNASWAFSTVDVATDRLVKVSKGKYGSQASYSVQMLISCTILRDNKKGCIASTTDIAWNRLNHMTDDTAIVEENCEPFTNGKDMTTCKISQEDIKQKTINCTNPAYRKKYDGSFLYASPVYLLKVSSDEDIMREILVQGPVQAIFKVYPDIFMYKQGVYQWSRLVPELHDTYHSVKILGWGTENGVDYWLCANSWGEDWGENGYFKIKRGECEIEQHVIAAWGHSKSKGEKN